MYKSGIMEEVNLQIQHPIRLLQTKPPFPQAKENCLNRPFEGQKGNSQPSVFCSNFPKATCQKFFTLRNSSLSSSFPSNCVKRPSYLSLWIEQPHHF